MNTSWQITYETLRNCFNSGKYDPKKIFPDYTTIIEMLQSPDFQAFLLEKAKNEVSSEDMTALRILTNICILYPADASTEIQLKEISELHDPWCAGLERVCGIGCNPDEKEGIRLLAKSKGPAGDYFGKLHNDAYALNSDICEEIMDLSANTSDHNAGSLNRLFTMYDKYRQNDLLLEQYLLLSICAEIIKNEVGFNTIHHQLNMMMYNDGYGKVSLLYHLARDKVLVYHNVKDQMDGGHAQKLDDLERALKTNSKRISIHGSPLGFIIDNTPERYDPGALQVYSRVITPRIYRLSEISPMVKATSIMGLEMPKALNLGMIASHPINMDSSEDMDPINDGMDEFDPQCFEYASRIIGSEDLKSQSYYLNVAMSLGHIPSQFRYSEENPDDKFWKHMCMYTGIHEESLQNNGSIELDSGMLLTNSSPVPVIASKKTEGKEVEREKESPTPITYNTHGICTCKDGELNKKRRFCMFCGRPLKETDWSNKG